MTSRERTRSRTLANQSAPVTGESKGGPLDYGFFLNLLETESMEDVVTPNFHKALANGSIINNPCDYTHRTYSVKDGSVTGAQIPPGTGWFNYDGPVTAKWRDDVLNSGQDPWSNHGYASVDTARLRQTARVNALSNVDTTAYAFGEDIGELRETVRFIKNPVSSLVDVGRAFRARVLKLVDSGWDLAAAVASVHLSARFALMPLIRSSHDAVDAFVGLPKQPPKRLNARGFAADDAESKDSASYVVGSSTVTFDRRSSVSEQHHATIHYEVSNPVSRTRWALGLRAKDIPDVMWQLLPYSFMVDRVVDITSFIRSTINLVDPNVKILAASHTVREEYSEELTLTDKVNTGWTQFVGQGPETDTVYTHKRDPYTPSIFDAVRPVELDGLVKDATRIADSLALFLSLVRR